MRSIAFYLPQFHPIPENDEWWGQGFTEWTNVARAKPLFRSHYQPHLPADLGFYDLRVPEVRQLQADVAARYRVSGFCYFHYWSRGRRILERPFHEVLASGKPDFPFCLCWANESWVRWRGRRRETLFSQEYSEEDDLHHVDWLLSAFEDRRYLRIDGRPLFLVYRAHHMPDPSRTTARWRARARSQGLGDLFLARVESYPQERDDPRLLGFDAAVQFQPDQVFCGTPTLWWRMGRRATAARWRYRYRRLDYRELVEHATRLPGPTHPTFRCVMPSWDNTPRYPSRALVFTGSSPQRFGAWVSRIVEDTRGDSTLPEPVFFVNAWNEWAEGNHLEPCQRWARGYLEAHERALRPASPP